MLQHLLSSCDNGKVETWVFFQLASICKWCFKEWKAFKAWEGLTVSQWIIDRPTKTKSTLAHTQLPSALKMYISFGGKHCRHRGEGFPTPYVWLKAICVCFIFSLIQQGFYLNNSTWLWTSKMCLLSEIVRYPNAESDWDSDSLVLYWGVQVVGKNKDTITRERWWTRKLRDRKLW